MASYRERIDRYIEAHPGASITEARGHGATPEHPGTGRTEERYQEYYAGRAEAEAKVNQLKEDMFGNSPSWNPQGAEKATGRIPSKELQIAAGYDSLQDYVDDTADGDWDEIDEDFGHYH